MPPNAPSLAVRLFGTDEPVDPPRILRAGRLSAELEAGNLRHIRFDGAEVLRAVSFIVRDRDWGTYNPVIRDLVIDETDGRLTVSFSAVASDAGQSFTYDAEIEGDAEGRLVYRGRGRSASGFLTNRTGFVVLHPIDGIAGAPVEITRTDGTVEQGTFPALIDPVQPMMDLRALAHTTPTGLHVTTLMQGDTFEMEDQRNWTDASYKTYVRPLALPWPYRIEAGEEIEQSVTVTIAGQVAAAAGTGRPVVAPGAASGRVPPLGLGLRPEDVAGTREVLDAVRALAPAYLVIHHDPREGHDPESLARQVAVARDLGAEAWLEVVVGAPCDADAAAEIADLGQRAHAMGDPFSTVLVSPAPDLKCTLPGSVWPDAPDAAMLHGATRAAFPGARIGGGMFSYFTELNRKRPPQDSLDLITFTTSPMVHAGDDRSVMQTREAHPAITASMAALAGATPWVVGPSAIGVRDNPYGEAAKANPDNIRQAMNRNDPRQRGLLGAAWALAYFADFAAGGAAGVALGAPVGAFGAVAVPCDFPQPWYDEHGGLYPVFHVLRGLARLRGHRMRALDLPAAGPIAGIAAETDAETGAETGTESGAETGAEIEGWIAHMGSGEVTLDLPSGARVARLDADRFAAAAGDPAWLDTVSPLDGTSLTLSDYAVARVLLTR